MNKLTILNDFINQFKHLPVQGSDAWKELRKNFIGGSEISTVLKQNKNKTVNKLVLEKLGFDKFHGNIITHWGNVFEELIRLYCEDTFSCEIKETGSIPYKHGNLSYSPDGLAVVSTNSLIKQFRNLPDGLDASSPCHLVLFEFKCPHSRIPSSTIPEHYWPQVNIGMNVIDIMETAIFVQATYRRCAFSQMLYNTDHNGFGHFKKADTTSNPIECGFMIIHTNEWDDYHNDLIDSLMQHSNTTEIYDNRNKPIVDLGSVTNIEVLEEVLGNCVNKSFNVDYSFRYKYEASTFDRDAETVSFYNKSIQHRAQTQLNKFCNRNENIIGVLPYKLLNVHFTSVVKDSNYIESTQAHAKAAKVLECINVHRGLENKSEVSKSIKRYNL